MKNIVLTLLLLFNLFFSHSSFAEYTYTYIKGNLCSQAKNGAPVPGLLISLVHPVIGRSVPVFTDNYGNFLMGNIPIIKTPYYLEVYWGKRLIYRNTVLVLGPVKLPRICI